MNISISLKVETEHGRKHDTIYLTQLCNWHFTFQKKSVKNCNHHRLNQMPDQRKTLRGCRLYHFVNVCCFANMQFQMMIKSPVNKWGLYVKKSQIAWTSLKWIVTWNKYLEIVLLFEKAPVPFTMHLFCALWVIKQSIERILQLFNLTKVTFKS